MSDETTALLRQAAEEIGITLTSVTQFSTGRVAASFRRADGTDGGVNIVIQILAGEAATEAEAQASRAARLKALEDEAKAIKGT